MKCWCEKAEECEQGIKEKGTVETLLNYVGGAGSVVMGLCC